MWPFSSNVGHAFAAGVKLVLVVASSMARILMGVVIPKDIPPALVPCVIRIADSPSLSPPIYRSDLKVLGNINDYASMAKDIPGNLTGFRGSLDLKRVINYKRVILHDSQHDVQVAF